MIATPEDHRIAARLRRSLTAAPHRRESKQMTALLDDFGETRLTRTVRERIAEALDQADIATDPPVGGAQRKDRIELSVRPSKRPGLWSRIEQIAARYPLSKDLSLAALQAIVAIVIATPVLATIVFVVVHQGSSSGTGRLPRPAPAVERFATCLQSKGVQA